MAVLSEKHSFIFFQNPRTGSTMMEKVLTEELGGRLFPEPQDWSEKMAFKHLTYHELVSKGFMDEHRLASFYKFTTVRNPYVKVVSDWLGGKKFYQEHRGEQTRIENILANESNSLEIYLKTILLPGLPADIRLKFAHLLPVPFFVFAAFGYRLFRLLKKEKFITSKMDTILLTENLEEGFKQLLRRLSISHDLRLPVVNKTDSIKRPYSDYHTQWTRRLTRIMYGDIIRKFNYSFPG